MSRMHRFLSIAVLIALAATGLIKPPSALASPAGVSLAARKLADFYDHLGVESRWIAGAHIDWETGDPDGRPETTSGKHTHCSAFVASAAERLGIYILRPPEHGQVLLANAQNEWLAGPGQERGWRALPDALAAQMAANGGSFVVASYHNHRDDKPGHIAIVRPSRKNPEAVALDGPDVIQAGGHNYTDVALRQGFAGHPHAWSENEIDYYAHEVPSGRL